MKLTVAIVGPCSSGKSTLRAALIEAGYDARQPAQEHSSVRRMWQRCQPDLLVYLDLSYEVSIARRRKSIADRLEIQRGRLSHARAHADFYLDTSDLTPAEVQAHVLAFLTQVTS